MNFKTVYVYEFYESLCVSKVEKNMQTMCGANEKKLNILRTTY